MSWQCLCGWLFHTRFGSSSKRNILIYPKTHEHRTRPAKPSRGNGAVFPFLPAPAGVCTFNNKKSKSFVHLNICHLSFAAHVPVLENVSPSGPKIIFDGVSKLLTTSCIRKVISKSSIRSEVITREDRNLRRQAWCSRVAWLRSLTLASCDAKGVQWLCVALDQPELREMPLKFVRVLGKILLPVCLLEFLEQLKLCHADSGCLKLIVWGHRRLQISILVILGRLLLWIRVGLRFYGSCFAFCISFFRGWPETNLELLDYSVSVQRNKTHSSRKLIETSQKTSSVLVSLPKRKL